MSGPTEGYTPETLYVSIHDYANGDAQVVTHSYLEGARTVMGLTPFTSYTRTDVHTKTARQRDLLLAAAKLADEVLDDLAGWLGEPQPDASIGHRDVHAFKALRAAIAECEK